MGYGIVDNQVSNNSCADKISNIMALNIGASMSPMEKLTLGADIWYAALAEDDAAGEDYLGTELDLSASYAIMDNLNLDVVAAYLFAGDATGGGDEDPMQLAAQLSLSF
jgi:outer membrane protein W